MPALLGKEQWDEYHPGFQLYPLALNRAPGRPRVNTVRRGADGRTVKRRPCKRCGELGHMQNNCNNAVSSTFVTDEGWGADEAAAAVAARAGEAAAKVAKAVAREFAERYVCLEFSMFVKKCLVHLNFECQGKEKKER